MFILTVFLARRVTQVAPLFKASSAKHLPIPLDPPVTWEKNPFFNLITPFAKDH